jgi:hypothetical protein
VALELAMDAGSRAGELAVAVEGVPSEVDWQLARVDEAMRAAGATPGRVLHAEAASGLLRQIAAFGGEGEGASLLRVRGAVLPARVPELIAAWREAVPAARVVAGIGSGSVRLAVPAESAAPVVRALRTAAAALGGHARVEALPAGGATEDVDRFGVAPDPLALRLKAALDPGVLWLPGSYLGLGGAVA